MALDKFAAYPELLEPIAPEEVSQYKEVLEYIYTILTPALVSENDYLWALGLPMRPVVFYTTDGFYDLLTEEGCEGEGCSLRPNLIQQTEEDWKNRKRMHLYSMVLGKLYGIPFNQADMVHKTLDDGTGLARYYRLDFDDRFINVKANAPLPELTLESLHDQLPATNEPLSILEKTLPLDMFTFEGMSVLTLTDVTAEYAVNTLKDIVVQHVQHAEEESFLRIEMALRSIAGKPDVHFGLLPLLRINDRFVYKHGTGLKSILIELAYKNRLEDEVFHSYVESYIQTPRVLFLRSITSLHRDLSPALKMLSDNGVRSFVLLPLYYQGKLSGVLEVYSDQPNAIDEKMLSMLNTASLTLSQLLQQSVDDLKADVSRVINDKFTPLQPSVQWKFNEAAWNYLQEIEYNGKGKIETVGFESVYPLYGAVDIRNSTIERNRAQLSDLQYQFAILLETLQEVKKHYSLALTDEMIYKCRKWKNTLEDSLTPHSEVKLTDFLEKEAVSFLKHFKLTHPGSASIVEKYFAAIEEMSGIAWTNRRELEESMQSVNTAVNNYLDLMKDELQQSYPCYFERFRTDGVEYDIYIGQSIAPQKPFDILYLKNLRLWQISSMAAIAKITHNLLPKLSKPLQTTQLIFIHSNTIDISFRNDERRFDAEGGYNIRYQVIKKRIDKVHVADTNERLTQPGKIALVYFNRRDADEYISHIQYLQEQGILMNDLEYLDLEELQGVAGLKALRVGINMEYDQEN